MKFRVKPSRIGGSVDIPGSKSHTIRALTFGLLAGGESLIEQPLDSSDTRSCVKMIQAFGASFTEEGSSWRVRGTGGSIPVPEDVIDTGNSGTTLYIGLGLAALCGGYTVFTGDHQIRSRPADDLLKSLNDLGAEAYSTRGSGKPPIVVRGRMRGGRTSVRAVTSQYLTSLLIAAPLADGETHIEVPLLNEAPYVAMTLAWLDRLGVQYKNEDYKNFHIPGRQSYSPFRGRIPADFSSAAFFLVAAAITGAELTLEGLDFSDTQGDKEVVDILRRMGARVSIDSGSVMIRGGGLTGGVFDLNAIPDALPALSVAACFAEGETRLVNVAQARLKETDRIRVMSEELARLGADVEELPDGLVVRRSSLRGTAVDGRGDHRIVMALSVAGLASEGEMIVDTAECVSVTFPNFFDLMQKIGADIRRE